jgi:hypothetical protein
MATKKPTQEKTKGVILVAFGKRGYYFAAYNLAFSIKYHSKDIKITLLTDNIQKLSGQLRGQLQYFDDVIQVPDELMYSGNLRKFEPGRLKVNLYQFLSYDYNMYLDVDTICLKDINPLFDIFINSGKYYAAHTVGYHTIDKGNEIESMQWAYANDIWEQYKLPKDAILPAINSSIAFISKGKEAERFFNKAAELFENPIPLEKLRMAWGGGQPDELYFNIAMAIMKHDPKVEGGCSLHESENGFMHFCRSYHGKLSDITENFYFQSYYGEKRFTPSRIIEWLEKLLIKWHYSVKSNHVFKLSEILKDKHANNR